MAVLALSEAGLYAIVQGVEGGKLLEGISPGRFPVMVDAAKVTEARLILSGLNSAAQLEQHARSEPLEVASVRRFRWPRLILGYLASFVACSVLLSLGIVLSVAVADHVHDSPHGHYIVLPVPFAAISGLVALLILASSGWSRRTVLIVPIVLIVIAAASVRPRPQTSESTAESRGIE